MKELIIAAQQARSNAYAPYSVYHVGAAILGANGKIYVGCNVENISYGLTNCAERVAVGTMVADGCLELKSVAVATREGGSPCGACRQVLVEFAHDAESVQVFCVDDNGTTKSYVLSELLPHGFNTELKK